MKAMHVAILAVAGDREPWQGRMIRGLIEAGVEVTAATPGEGDFFQQIIRNGQPDLLHLRRVERLVDTGRSWFGRRWRTAAVIQRLENLHAAGVRIIWTVDEIDRSSKRGITPVRQLRTALASIADRILVEDASIIPQIERAYSTPVADRIDVIRSAIDEEDFESQSITSEDARAALGIPGCATVFAMVDTISVRHGIGVVLNAFNALDDDSAWLIIAGESRLSERERDWVSQRLRERRQIIYHPGRIEPESVQAYLKAADVAILPARGVAESGAVLRAMWMSRPILVPVGGLAEAIARPAESWCYQNDETGLAERMSAIAHYDESDRLAMRQTGEANRALVAERSWADVISETINAYKAGMIKSTSDRR